MKKLEAIWQLGTILNPSNITAVRGGQGTMADSPPPPPPAIPPSSR